MRGRARGPRRDSAGAFWAAVVFTIATLVLLVIFILDNGRHVQVSYFDATWQPPLGVALLLAALFGGLVIVLAVGARMLQVRHRSHQSNAPHRGAPSAALTEVEMSQD